MVAVGSWTHSRHIKQEVPFLEEILGQSFYPHVKPPPKHWLIWHIRGIWGLKYSMAMMITSCNNNHSSDQVFLQVASRTPSVTILSWPTMQKNTASGAVWLPDDQEVVQIKWKELGIHWNTFLLQWWPLWPTVINGVTWGPIIGRKYTWDISPLKMDFSLLAFHDFFFWCQKAAFEKNPPTKKSHTWSHNSVVTNILGPTKKHIFPIHPFNQNVWNVHLRKPNFWSSQVFSWESWSKIGGAKPPHSPIRLMEEAGHMRLEAPWKGTYLSRSEMKNNCLPYVYPKNHGISKLVLEILQAPCEKQSQIPL